MKLFFFIKNKKKTAWTPLKFEANSKNGSVAGMSEYIFHRQMRAGGLKSFNPKAKDAFQENKQPSPPKPRKILSRTNQFPTQRYRWKPLPPSPPTGSGNGNGNGGNVLPEKNQCEAKNIQRIQTIICKAELFRRLVLWIWANLFFFCRWGWWLLAPTNSSSSSSSNPFQKRLGLKHNDSSLSSMGPNWSEFWRWRKGWRGWWVTWGWQAWTSPSTTSIPLVAVWYDTPQEVSQLDDDDNDDEAFESVEFIPLESLNLGFWCLLSNPPS